jgi:hypothetical protein
MRNMNMNMKTMRYVLATVAVGCFALAAAPDAIGQVTVVNFDDVADGTVVDSVYAARGVTFSNPLGGSVFARNGSGFAPSAPNVVSIFSTGFPDYSAFYGAVDATFSTPKTTVSIDARPVATFEPLGTPRDRPFLEAYSGSTFLGRVLYAGALPTNGRDVGPTETLTFTSPTANITRVRFSVQQNQGGPRISGLFDNLGFSPCACAGDLHVLASTTDGTPWHTIRQAAGSWLTFGDVTGQAGNPGVVGSVTSALIGGDLHVVVQTSDGLAWHTIRQANGTWLPFGDITGQAGNPGFIQDVSISGNTANGDLHVLASTTDGRLWHTIRQANGSWLTFGDVTGQAGNPGVVGSVASALIGGDLHVVVQTSNDGGAWHTIRRANGTWLLFGDVFGQAGNPGSIQDVSISGNGATGDLHVLASTTDGGVWHTIRQANGGWLPFGDVTGQAGNPGVVGSVATALIGGDLHVVVQTSNDGKAWHTIRRANGAWLFFGDVTGQAGNPGSIQDVTISSTP